MRPPRFRYGPRGCGFRRFRFPYPFALCRCVERSPDRSATGSPFPMDFRVARGAEERSDTCDAKCGANQSGVFTAVGSHGFVFRRCVVSIGGIRMRHDPRDRPPRVQIDSRDRLRRMPFRGGIGQADAFFRQFAAANCPFVVAPCASFAGWILHILPPPFVQTHLRTRIVHGFVSRFFSAVRAAFRYIRCRRCRACFVSMRMFPLGKAESSHASASVARSRVDASACASDCERSVTSAHGAGRISIFVIQ